MLWITCAYLTEVLKSITALLPKISSGTFDLNIILWLLLAKYRFYDVLKKA